MIRLFITSLAIAGFMIIGPAAKEKPSPPESSIPDYSDADSIVWLNYDDAAAKAQAEGKHIFIHFTTKWCGWCRKMERETYTDPKVIKMMNTSFAPVKVWADSKEEIDVEGYRISQTDLAKQEFGVTGYPEFWFVRPDHMKVGPLKGYIPVDRFLRALTYVRDYQYDTTRTESKAPNQAPSDK